MSRSPLREHTGPFFSQRGHAAQKYKVHRPALVLSRSAKPSLSKERVVAVGGIFRQREPQVERRVGGRRQALRERGGGRWQPVCSTCSSVSNQHVLRRDVRDTGAQLLPVSLPSRGERW